MFAPKTILWPTDFSDPSYEALEAAAAVAQAFEAELILLHVVEPESGDSDWPDSSKLTIPLPVQEERDRTKRTLEKVATEKVPGALRCRTEVIVGDAEQDIVGYADKEGVELIVIATHGRTGWLEAGFGSVAEKVSQKAQCPVLSLRTRTKN